MSKKRLEERPGSRFSPLDKTSEEKEALLPAVLWKEMKKLITPGYDCKG